MESFDASHGSVLSAKFSNLDSTEFISGTAGGDIYLWDIRNPHPVLKVETVQGQFSHFQIHDQAPLMAW